MSPDPTDEEPVEGADEEAAPTTGDTVAEETTDADREVNDVSGDSAPKEIRANTGAESDDANGAVDSMQISVRADTSQFDEAIKASTEALRDLNSELEYTASLLEELQEFDEIPALQGDDDRPPEHAGRGQAQGRTQGRVQNQAQNRAQGSTRAEAERGAVRAAGDRSIPEPDDVNEAGTAVEDETAGDEPNAETNPTFPEPENAPGDSPPES